MNVDTAPHEFEAALLRHLDLCYAVARTLTSDPELAERLAEETLLRAWGDRDTLDLSSGLKVALLTRLRAQYVEKYRGLAEARRAPNVVPYPKRTATRLAFAKKQPRARAVRH